MYSRALVALLLLLLSGLWASVKQQLAWLKRTRGVEAGVPMSKCRSAAQGYVRLYGVQQHVDGKPLQAPLTGKPCTWWSFTVEKRKGWHLDDSPPEWRIIRQASSTSPVLLDDGTGQVLVDVTGERNLIGPRDCWHGDTELPIWPPSILTTKDNYRYTEQRMVAGTTLYVAGQLTTRSSIPSPTAIKDRALRMLTRWKGNQASLRERFDRNHDGVIDPDEWEAARQAALGQAESELARELDSGVNGRSVVSRPTDGKPFVITPMPDMNFSEPSNPSRPTLFWLIAFLVASMWCIGALAGR